MSRPLSHHRGPRRHTCYAGDNSRSLLMNSVRTIKLDDADAACGPPRFNARPTRRRRRRRDVTIRRGRGKKSIRNRRHAVSNCPVFSLIQRSTRSTLNKCAVLYVYNYCKKRISWSETADAWPRPASCLFLVSPNEALQPDLITVEKMIIFDDIRKAYDVLIV